MDSELREISIDNDEIKLEQQDSNIQESQEISSSQIISPTQQSPQKSLANSQIRYSQKISFHLSEQVSSSVLQLYENIQYTLYSQIEDKPSSTVYRKYTHFEWLNAALKRELPGLIVPAVPPKNMLAKINLAERTQCIREKRFRQLDEFLMKVIQNSKLQTCPKFLIFLTASPEIMQQELQEMLQYHSYAKQMGTALLSAGSKAYDIAKGSINYFSSFIYTQQPIQKQIQFPDLEIIQDIKEFFESWEDLLVEEQKKVRKIFEYYNSIVNIKLEQNEETRKIISAMRDLNVDELNQCIKKQSASVYLNENLLNEIRNNVLFKLELCCFDIDEAINIIKVRNDLIDEIQQQIKIHNQSESLNEKLQLKEEIIKNQKILKTLESNFQVDVKSFAIWLNKYLQQLIQTYNEQFQKLYSEQNKNWND